MPVCNICKNEAHKLYDGVCSACLTVRAVESEKRESDAINELQGIELNTPFGKDTKPIVDFWRHAYHSPEGLSEGYIRHHIMMDSPAEDSHWETIKLGVVAFINKYRDQIISKKYDFGTVNQYFTNSGINKILIEKMGPIAIWKIDED